MSHKNYELRGRNFCKLVCIEDCYRSTAFGIVKTAIKKISVCNNRGQYVRSYKSLVKIIRFQKGDIFRSDYSKRKFDLFVSNLVFHNFDRKRFNAHERLTQWATLKSCIALGDLFFDYKKDYKILTSLFGSVQVRPDSIIDRAYKILVLSEPKK
jgi:hypothetical protein